MTETLQFSSNTKRWSFLDDDNGHRYVISDSVEAEAVNAPLCYSVDYNTGALFEVNYQNTSHPYDGYVRSDVLDSRYKVSPTAIVSRVGVAFHPFMVGDTIRVGDETRIILTASNKRITFASWPGLRGKTFIIAPTRVRVRWAHLAGSLPVSVLVLEELSVKLRPGDRAADNPVTLNLYRDYEDTVIDSKTVDIFNPGDAGRRTEDRVVGLVGDGEALEIELESLLPDADFYLESLYLVVREDGDGIADAEA